MLCEGSVRTEMIFMFELNQAAFEKKSHNVLWVTSRCLQTNVIEIWNEIVKSYDVMRTFL